MFRPSQRLLAENHTLTHKHTKNLTFLYPPHLKRVKHTHVHRLQEPYQHYELQFYRFNNPKGFKD